jgi:non-ribosomal peptide synthetase component F
MMVLQNAPLERMEVPGLEIRQVGGEGKTAKFDLTMFVQETGEGLTAWLEYNTDLFNETTIRQMLETYEDLLEEVVKDVERDVDTIPLITDDERRQLTESWS